MSKWEFSADSPSPPSGTRNEGAKGAVQRVATDQGYRVIGEAAAILMNIRHFCWVGSLGYPSIKQGSISFIFTVSLSKKASIPKRGL